MTSSLQNVSSRSYAMLLNMHDRRQQQQLCSFTFSFSSNLQRQQIWQQWHFSHQRTLLSKEDSWVSSQTGAVVWSELLLPECCSLGVEHKMCSVLFFVVSNFCKRLNLLRKHFSATVAVQKTAAFLATILKWVSPWHPTIEGVAQNTNTM